MKLSGSSYTVYCAADMVVMFGIAERTAEGCSVDKVIVLPTLFECQY